MKKGSLSSWMALYMPRIGLALIVSFIFIFLVGSFVLVNIETYELNADLFVQGILNLQGGFIYTNTLIGRTDPYTIDLELLEDITNLESRLLDLIQYDNPRKIAARIEVFQHENNQWSRKAVFFYNKRGYTLLEPLIGKRGAPVHRKETAYPIALRRSSSFFPGKINIEVLQAT